MSYDEYLNAFIKANPDLTDIQLAKIRAMLRRGCVGLTCINLGKIPIADCYKTLDLALEQRDRCKCDKSKARIFSIHLKNDIGKDGTAPDLIFDSSGKADLRNWDFGNDPGLVYYDFGWLEEWLVNYMVSATGAHNPGRRYVPEREEHEMRVMVKSVRKWSAGAPAFYGHTDFNAEVWCISCNDGEHQYQILRGEPPIYIPGVKTHLRGIGTDTR